MTTPLLQTKLHIPSHRPKLVPRLRLIEQLNEGLHRKLTLLSAPAGFGKTTLVSEWVDHLRLDAVEVNERRIAWLSLDESDNDPTRFLAYVIAALQTIEASLGVGALSALQSPQPPTEVGLTALINEVAALPGRILLVLDDYHLIDARPVHDALTFLLRHLPPQMHLVIVTREDPLLPLARLRARGQLTELRAADLRFTSSEAAQFLNQVMGLDLSAKDVAALERRTEGWIAGLQLAAISMGGRKDVTGFIQSFTGSHHFVLDYLVQEVLEQQPESVQTFLLRTSILDRLTGPLCDALTGQEHGRTTLEMLAHANLFTVPLDEERRWYRYHHLFADLLRQRLHRIQPEQVPTLHHRASEWYERSSFMDEAIEHALRADDFERAAHLIKGHADALWGRGGHVKLRRWLVKLPVEFVFSKPHLCVFHAWYLFTSGQQDAAEQSLQVAEGALGSSTDRAAETEPAGQDRLTGADRAQLRGRIAAVRAFMDSHRGDVPGMIQHARQALEYLPEQDRTWRSITAMVLGDAHGFKGDMAAAYQARLEALKACEAAGDSYYVMLASVKLAITLRSQGRLQRTIEICQQQIQLANERGLSQTSLTGLLLLIRGEVLAELNDLDGALREAEKGIELAARGVDLALVGWGYMCLIRVLFSRGDLAGIQEIVQDVGNRARESNVPPWIMSQMAAWQARIWLVQHKLEAASQWAQERGLITAGEPKPLHAMDFFLLFDHIVLARILIAESRLNEATGLLQRLLEPAEAGGRTTRVIEILLLQALAFQAGGDTGRAIPPLERALTLAEPEGYIRIFIDEGPPMAHLLYKALASGIAPGYVRRLLAAFPAAEPEQTDLLEMRVRESELVEPLSERELEVLQLLAEGLTNHEIASRLFLSLNTVKAHTRNIYGKLDTHSRTQAVARGRSLGILASI